MNVNNRVWQLDIFGDVKVQESKSQVHSHKLTVNSRPLIESVVSELVLSTFSGLDLLGKGFSENGFCVVQAGDKILDNDICDFHCPKGRFDGVVGGPPCQDFSKLRRIAPTGNGLKMIHEFIRIVLESDCNWFLMENVLQVPNIEIEGYVIQRFVLSPNELGFPQSRKRYFQFGSKHGRPLIFRRTKYDGTIEPCVLASDGRRKHKKQFETFCELQGMNYTPDLSEFTKSGKYKLVGNAVHLGVSTTIAEAIREATYNHNRKYGEFYKTCPCGCGEILKGKEYMKTATCRKRMQLKREHAAAITKPEK